MHPQKQTEPSRLLVELHFYMCVVEFKMHNLKLIEGKQYFATVKACSVAGLCVTTTSDGVQIDTVPPHIARVIDGSKAHDVDYQSSR